MASSLAHTLKRDVVELHNAEIFDDEQDNFAYRNIDDDFEEEKTDDNDYNSLMRTVYQKQMKSSTEKLDKLVYSEIELFSIDDYLRNVLYEKGLVKTLDCFNKEFYGTSLNRNSKPKDIKQENEELCRAIRELTDLNKQLNNTAVTAKATWDKFRKERDFHKQQFQRVLSEKEILRSHTLRLKGQISLYEPTMKEIRKKHEQTTKDKMIIKLEIDKLRETQAQLKLQLNKLEHIDGNGEENKTRHTKTRKYTKIPTDIPENPYNKLHFNPVDGRQISISNSLDVFDSGISAICTHPKKPLIAVGFDNSEFRLYNIPSFELISTTNAHSDWVGDLKFSPTGNQLISCSGDCTIKQWDYIEGKLLYNYNLHSQHVWSVSYHHTGDFFVSGSQDTQIRLWDTNYGKCRQVFRGHIDSVNCVEFFKYSPLFLSCSADKTLSIWDIRNGQAVQTFFGHYSSITSIASTNTGDKFISGDSTGNIIIWSSTDMKDYSTINVSNVSINSLSLDRSGTILSAACNDNYIYIIDIYKKEVINKLKGHNNIVNRCLFDEFGKYLLSGGNDKSLKLWSL